MTKDCTCGGEPKPCLEYCKVKTNCVFWFIVCVAIGFLIVF